MYRANLKNGGYSIVSLLVGMAISLILFVGLVHVYVNSKSSFVFQAALEATTENGRFAIEDLGRALFMTGRGLLAFQSAFPDVGSDLYDGSAGASDGLAVISAGGVDCQGGTVSAPIRQSFSVEADDEGNSAMKCSIDGGAEQTLVSGIEWMQVLYGVDDDADATANRYLNATEVNTEDLWQNVVALRIGLVVSSGEFRVPTSPQSLTPTQITVLDEIYTPSDDTLLYKTLTTTIPLRNLASVER